MILNSLNFPPGALKVTLSLIFVFSARHDNTLYSGNSECRANFKVRGMLTGSDQIGSNASSSVQPSILMNAVKRPLYEARNVTSSTLVKLTVKTNADSTVDVEIHPGFPSRSSNKLQPNITCGCGDDGFSAS